MVNLRLRELSFCLQDHGTSACTHCSKIQHSSGRKCVATQGEYVPGFCTFNGGSAVNGLELSSLSLLGG